VASEADARSVVGTAVEAFGKVDILVNNASIAFFSAFDELSSEDVVAQVNVHLLGTIWMCRAVWPYMRDAQYGRIVNTTSRGMLGAPNASVYGAVKGGIFSLTRGLAIDGSPHGIRCNSFSPEAVTRVVQMTHEENSPQLERMRASTPELVAPVVAFLAHEECPATGENLLVGGGQVARMALIEAAGFSNPGLTPEAVRDNFDRVMDLAQSSPIHIRLPDATSSHRKYKTE
jgi:NAD(P)-dependent dehydrogenase (short-subunit alcohol dehydrogenase family)